MVTRHTIIDRARNKRLQIWLGSYKEKVGCQICRYKGHPEILIVHHKELIRRKNTWDRTSFLGRKYSISRMKEELKKCLILCPNCHAWIHYSGSQFNYKKPLVSNIKNIKIVA